MVCFIPEILRMQPRIWMQDFVTLCASWLHPGPSLQPSPKWTNCDMSAAHPPVGHALHDRSVTNPSWLLITSHAASWLHPVQPASLVLSGCILTASLNMIPPKKKQKKWAGKNEISSDAEPPPLCIQNSSDAHPSVRMQERLHPSPASHAYIYIYIYIRVYIYIYIYV